MQPYPHPRFSFRHSGQRNHRAPDSVLRDHESHVWPLLCEPAWQSQKSRTHTSPRTSPGRTLRRACPCPLGLHGTAMLKNGAEPVAGTAEPTGIFSHRNGRSGWVAPAQGADLSCCARCQPRDTGTCCHCRHWSFWRRVTARLPAAPGGQCSLRSGPSPLPHQESQKRTHCGSDRQSARGSPKAV